MIIYPSSSVGLAQVTDNKPNRVSEVVSLKVSRATVEWVKDEQTRIRKSTGSEPTQAQVIERLISHYETGGAATVTADGLNIPGGMVDLVRWFIRWYKTKHDPMIEARKAEMAQMAAEEEKERSRERA